MISSCRIRSTSRGVIFVVAGGVAVVVAAFVLVAVVVAVGAEEAAAGKRELQTERYQAAGKQAGWLVGWHGRRRNSCWPPAADSCAKSLA